MKRAEERYSKEKIEQEKSAENAAAPTSATSKPSN